LMQNDDRPTHLDICSGISGFGLAFQAAGFRTVGFAEINEYASDILAWHWPTVTNFGDFRGVPTNRVDVLTGGIPCQPASVAGKRRGSRDQRWLWDDGIKLCGVIRPRFAVLENPTGILTVDGGTAFNRILTGFYEIGFDVWWETVPACAVGADHPRDRVIIVAHNYSDREPQLQ
jgi:DNA (cytosine-5)-methyltransferase 1